MCASVSARASQFDELRARVPAARPWGRVRRHPRSRPRPTPAGHWPSASRLTMTLPATRPPRPPPALQSSSSLLVPPCDGASFKSLPKNNSRKNHENGSHFLLLPDTKPQAPCHNDIPRRGLLVPAHSIQPARLPNTHLGRVIEAVLC